MNTKPWLMTVLMILCTSPVYAKDWPGFRGADFQARTSDALLPVTWSETENVSWKKALPGFGASSPIVVRDRVFVTCYTGYGQDKGNPGDPNQLVRQLLCINAITGEAIWSKSVKAVQPELPYKGMVCEHGYASSTPVSDGERVYVFFGKSGVLAFDLEGHQLWQQSVGTQSDDKKWGSATSPVLYEDLVIVNAWDESQKLLALNKTTGKPVWEKDLSGTGLTFTTPVVAPLKNHTSEMIVALPTQVWGLAPQTGELLWIVKTAMKDSTLNLPVVAEGIVYVYGGGPSNLISMAIRLGGRGDVTESHVVWSSKEAVSVPTPVAVDGHLYWVDSSGRACCQDIQTGALVYGQELPGAGRFAVYASVLEAQGRLYAVTRKGGAFVLPATPEFKILAHNSLASDDSEFNGSPAVSQNKMYLRSNRFLYCISLKPASR